MNAKNWRETCGKGVADRRSRSTPRRSRSTRPTWRRRCRASPTTPALFTAINKDTAELHHELVPFDAGLAQRMSDRAVRILRATDAGELLPRVATTRDFLDCRFCPWAERCWALPADERRHHRSTSTRWRDFNDAPPPTTPFGIEPDPAQIAIFLDVVFGYCEG